ncbi:TolC family protein [Cupriavidus taiwanensis]|uniref:Protein CyaE n=1 Tax=Cupriavidus taiwanensis TaxID=164546 RepID=A0A375JB66_9BURK|nr:TolC family protein [Cupriavidus taiwanensis]SPS02337.1 Outer membrane efflux protein precursor [Cupriavidus taiwanensis]
MNARRIPLTLILAGLWGLVQDAQAFDPLRAEQHLPATPAGALIPDIAGCRAGPPVSPLLLGEAVERALCVNPKTRQAWADVKAQAAGVGTARAGYLPTVNGTGQYVRDGARTDVTGHPNLSSATLANVGTGNVTLNWVLYDFGARSAAVSSASALLAAAQSTQDATVQSLFVTTAKDYYTAQASAGALVAARDVEAMAANSLRAASGRVDKGVAPISDALQAQTAYTQAVLNRAKADGQWQTAVGTLAADMNLSPDVPLTLPGVGDEVRTDAQFTQAVGELIEGARQAHPSVMAAEAQVDAAAARVDQTRAEGMPSLGLVSRYSLNNQPATLGLGVPSFPATGRDWYVGIQLTIPLFEGFGRLYRIHQAQAQLERENDGLDAARQQVGLEVWSSYQAVRTATDSVKYSATLLDTAQQSFNAAEHRYQAGVGNILELLNAQTALANAKQQRVQALADWKATRLRLAGSLGRLGMNNVQVER